ncbi:MAG TPA: ATP-binding cassette domain-containing protein [Vicinamibacterales bacterium]|jgi:osmoprotectant transport system ATP-binding protein|nr:ATP-binding cassette domain-containing protein [Vicinamibacterales bacterium]
MVVTFDRVDFGYPRGPATLRGFSLEVGRGEVVALVGRSGSGKTTVLKLANRLLLPDAGDVRIEGRSTREWDGIRLRRRIGYVFQDVGLFPHMSVEDNAGIVLRLEGWQRPRAAERARELLDLVGLPPADFAHRMPDELSGGQRQRVGLARALALGPPILLMDEPFGALDPVTRLEVRRAFARIQQQTGTSVILVTHDMGEAFSVAHRIGLLDSGSLVVVGSPQEVARASDPRVRAFVETALTVDPASR